MNTRNQIAALVFAVTILIGLALWVVSRDAPTVVSKRGEAADPSVDTVRINSHDSATPKFEESLPAESHVEEAMNVGERRGSGGAKLQFHHVPENAEWLAGPPDGSTLRRFLPSPDGRYRAYLTTPSEWPPWLNLHIQDTSTGEWQLVERSSEMSEIVKVAWEPLGQGIVFVEYANPGSAIYRYSTLSGEVKFLAAVPETILDIAVDETGGTVFAAHGLTDSGEYALLVSELSESNRVNILLELVHGEDTFQQKYLSLVTSRDEVWLNHYNPDRTTDIVSIRYRNPISPSPEVQVQDGFLMFWDHEESRFAFSQRDGNGLYIHDIAEGETFDAYAVPFEGAPPMPRGFGADGNSIVFSGHVDGVIDREAVRAGETDGLGLFAVPFD